MIYCFGFPPLEFYIHGRCIFPIECFDCSSSLILYSITHTIRTQFVRVSLFKRELVCDARLRNARYYSADNKFERFRELLELISRFEFDFRCCENYFLNDSIFFGVFGVQSRAM